LLDFKTVVRVSDGSESSGQGTKETATGGGHAQEMGRPELAHEMRCRVVVAIALASCDTLSSAEAIVRTAAG
jgi:hypothetical protein